jgi:hypothetical protein
MKQESLDGHGEWRLSHRTDTAGFGMRVPTHRQMTTLKQFTHHARTAAFVVVSYAHVRLRLRGQIDGDHDQGSFLERWEKLSPPPLSAFAFRVAYRTSRRTGCCIQPTNCHVDPPAESVQQAHSVSAHLRHTLLRARHESIMSET